MSHVDAFGRVTVWRRVVRNGTSPLNPKVKYSQLECGHDVWGPRRLKVGSLQACADCARKAEKESSR